jgi:hypothetical protein
VSNVEGVMTSSPKDLLSELGARMAGSAPGLQTANRLCVACVELLDVDGAAISVVQEGVSRGTFGVSGDSSRRLDEYQFTFGEGPCLDAVAARSPVLAADLNSPHERRWPAFSDAVLADGIRAVFAVPIVLASACIGALDLFREQPGSLSPDQLAGAALAAEMARLPLLDLASGLAPGPGGSTKELTTARYDLDRVEVYQATGILIAQLDVGKEEALARLRGHAVATGQTASEVAWAIIEGRLELEAD